MARIRVGFTSTTRHMLGVLPTPKFTDMEKTQLATDRETGEPLYTVTLFVMEDGAAEAIKVTVPKSGLPNGLNVGAFVRPLDLFATPWARVFNGQLQDGIAYRASGLEVVAMPAPQVADEPSEIAA
ncbi:SCO3933 family regulatory protein [Streptomyces cinereoruber]|uniref:SCO3933 family regulatory protein n=1 Tax=Streptomyces cinereoruber TaxID=67260 RepID=UPI003630A347